VLVTEGKLFFFIRAVWAGLKYEKVGSWAAWARERKGQKYHFICLWKQ